MARHAQLVTREGPNCSKEKKFGPHGFLPQHSRKYDELPNRSPATKNCSAGLSRTPVLPPITCSSDKKFLDSIETYIQEETEKLAPADQLDAEQQCIIYGNAFDKVIDHCTDYKAILTAIKHEYDVFIDAIKQGQRDAVHLQGKLKVLASEPTTLMYYRKRAHQLTNRIEIIQNDSRRIESQLQKIRDGRKVNTSQEEEKVSPQTEIKPYRRIPGMTIEDSFSMDALIEYQKHLKDRRQALKFDMKHKYVPLKMKQELDQKLSHAVQERDEAELINQRLRLGYRRRQVIADAISSWKKSDKSVTLYTSISQVIGKETELRDDVVPTKVFDDDDDPGKTKEAETLIEYVKRFNELFVDGQYKAAAVYAANSPRGILRNTETMEKFKAVALEGQVRPLMLFFEALVGSSFLTKHPVNAALTLDGITCALAHNKLDLVIHWVKQQRLTFSEALGDVISDYGEREPPHKFTCLALAELIYRKCASHRKTALCMCFQGQVQGAMDYTYQCKHFLLDDYLFLLKNCPDTELIHALTEECNGKPAALSVGQAVLCLICTDHKDHGFQLLESIHKCGQRALEQVIINDVRCTPEEWVEIAVECSNNNYMPLSEKIMSIVISQDGVVEMSSKDEDAKIMDHVFM
ncbi:clathrin heavy chain linker domain-containing protein 1 isoform X1 [Ascaphus truei]|uniref:clathrin heavy chain linker domain-containing protein 1 isoform X1 n=1 Tax=Ascaphus truei TaxID=8439 RepID=UPI003F59E6A6